MTGTQGRTLLSPHPVPFREAVEVPHIPGVERMAPEEAGRATAPGASEALQGLYGCARVLARAAGCLYSSSAAFLRCHGFLARFTGREPAATTAASVSRGRRLSGSSSWSGCPYRMPPPLATFFLLASTFLGIAEACSSRSTPKPRAPSPTARPNITFHTYACPPAYAAWYCLNGATCFTVKIGESLLYNCECADGYMGQRCEFKDLENSYLPSRRRVMLETASIASGATIAVFLVVIVCLAFYIHFKRKHKPPSDTNMSSEPGTCQVDGVERRRPFSGRPPSISLVPMRHPHPIPSPECYPAPTHGQHRSRPYPMDQGPGVYIPEYGDPHHSQYPVAPFASSSMVAPWSHGMEASHSSTVLSVPPRYHLPIRGSEPRHSHRDRPPDRVPSHHPPPPPPPPHGAVEYDMRSQ